MECEARREHSADALMCALFAWRFVTCKYTRILINMPVRVGVRMVPISL